MPSVAKKLAIVPKDEPLPLAEESVAAEARPEELRLLEALLFAAGEPLDEATLARQLPNGVELKDALARLKAEYAPRGVNLVRIGKKWTFRTANDLAWLLTKQTVETRKLSRAAIDRLTREMPGSSGALGCADDRSISGGRFPDGLRRPMRICSPSSGKTRGG